MARVADLSRELGIGLNQSYDLVNSGRIPVFRNGRTTLIAWSTIDKILAGELLLSASVAAE